MTDAQTTAMIGSVLMLVLVLSSLLGRRIPWSTTAKMAGAWIGIFALLAVLFSFRAEIGEGFRRILNEGSGGSQDRASGEYRIPMDDSGHFVASVSINGRTIRMLVDTGATYNAVSLPVARAVGLNVDDTGFPVVIQTANGSVEARRARAETIAIGDIRQDDVAFIAFGEDEDLSVLGMNFLSALSSWRVEGRTLILKP